MDKRTFKEGDEVINIKTGKKYCIDRIEKVHNIDLQKEIPTGYVECRPHNLDDNLPDYNRFPTEDLKLNE